jgi:hypothetical protein
MYPVGARRRVMIPTFTPIRWAMLNELAAEFAASSEGSTSSTKRKLRAAMRGLGFRITRVGERNVSPQLLARLLEEKRVRVKL